MQVQTLIHRGQDTGTDAHSQRPEYRYRHSLTEDRIQLQTLTHRGQDTGTDTHSQRPEYRYRHSLTEARIQ
jgi:hypothetical protein